MRQAVGRQPGSWHASLTPGHWKILTASFLGWIFDGYETYALISVLGPALLALLPVEQHARLPEYAGLAIGLTLLGWAAGGTIGGIVADYVGRKRMMLISIVGYAAFTGLTAFSTNIGMLIALRFLTGLFIGSEWSTGNTLLAEAWPNEARPKGAGFLQSGFGFGAFIAAGAWYVLRPMGPDAWRWMFGIGIFPAVLVFYIRRSIDESARWVETIKAKRWDVTEAASAEEGKAKRPFTLLQLFEDAEGRRRVLLGLGMSLATTLGWWGVATWIPGYVGGIAKAAGLDAAHWGSVAGIVYNAGAIVGYLASGFLADAMGRRVYLAFLFVGSLVLTPAVYVWSHTLHAALAASLVNGFFTLGGFAWFAIYLPELFATNVRATASAFVFNVSRFVAFLGPIFAGVLIHALHGVSSVAVALGMIYILGLLVAPFVPETRGRPLPA
ncbi:MAG: MFS transporter [Betaproteobacteria bacterium]|nr:MFS transporter [Betaproteobacteria bacterium]